jgi:hypothetical protein
MATVPARRARIVSALLCALGLAVVSGCDGGPKRVPVKGTVTLDGQPLTGGVLHFYPDPDKGNMHRVDCLSPVRDGKFNLLTTAVKDSESGDGAPVGWYKVYLYTEIPDLNLKIDPKFTDPARTPIEVEVKEKPEPGDYDIKFTSK